MAAQVPQSFHNRPSHPPKPFHFHQAQIILRVVLSLGAIGLLEIDLPFGQAASTASAEEAQSQAIPELEILREETESISRGLLQERPISEAPSDV